MASTASKRREPLPGGRPRLAAESDARRPETWPEEGRGDAVRLANRVAILTFLTAGLLVASLLLLPTALAADESPLARLAAAAPFAATAAGAVWVRRLRAELQGWRRRAGGGAGPPR
jgi:hypothetical protein